MLTDSFRGDLDFFKSKLTRKDPFSITRFGDGEMMIMNNQKLNLLFKGEFNFNGQEEFRSDLLKAFQHNQDNYFVGIACRCCVGDANFKAMRDKTKLSADKLTWANIFVNSNYPIFRELVVPTFSLYDVTLVSPGSIDNLPFKVDTHYKIGPDAWIHNSDVLEKLANKLEKESDKHHLVLICAGPYANILSYKLFSRFPTNTIIDLGSVFNIELGIGANRGYLQGSYDLRKTCVW